MTYEIIHYKEAYQDNWNFVHRAISKAIVTFPEATMSDGTKLASICPIGPEKFIWLVVPNITKAEQLRDWIEMVAGLPEPAVQRAFEGQDADEACVEISNLLWPSETEKPKESRQWEEIISCFDELIQKAQEIKLDLLWVCGRRAKMIILAESLDDLDSAMAIGMDTLKKSGDPRIQYLIQQFIGHQYYYLKKYEDAYPWLERAANQDVRINPRGRIRTLMFLSETVVEDPSRAVEIAQDGVNFARENESITEAELVRALAELSIAKWLASDNMSLIFEILEETCNRLLACKEDNIFWKALFIRLQNTVIYFSGHTSNSEPAQNNGSGTCITKPFRGMFYTTNDEAISKCFDEANSWFLPSKMADFAEALKKDDSAAQWAMRALDSARSSERPHAILLLSKQLIPFMLKDCRFGEVLDIALHAACVFVAIKQVGDTAGTFLSTSFNPNKILGKKPNDLWNEAEQNAAILGQVPIAFRILSVALKDEEKAQDYSEEVASLCRQIGAKASLPDYWKISAEFFDGLFADSVSGKDLISKAKTLNKLGYGILTPIAWLFLGFKQDCGLKTKAYAQLQSIADVSKAFDSAKSIYRLVVLPFVRDYWNNVFQRSKFDFSIPLLVERELKEVEHLPEEQQIKQILKIVSRGLSLKLNNNIKSWLYDNPNN